MEELIGKEVRVVFNLPITEWPIEGYPAWCVCNGVHGNMIKLCSKWGDTQGGTWYNMSIIKSIG